MFFGGDKDISGRKYPEMIFWQDQSASHWFFELFREKESWRDAYLFYALPSFGSFSVGLSRHPPVRQAVFLAMDREFSFSPPSPSFCSLVYSKSNKGLTQNPFRGKGGEAVAARKGG